MRARKSRCATKAARENWPLLASIRLATEIETAAKIENRKSQRLARNVRLELRSIVCSIVERIATWRKQRATSQIAAASQSNSSFVTEESAARRSRLSLCLSIGALRTRTKFILTTFVARAKLRRSQQCVFKRARLVLFKLFSFCFAWLCFAAHFALCAFVWFASERLIAQRIEATFRVSFAVCLLQCSLKKFNSIQLRFG